MFDLIARESGGREIGYLRGYEVFDCVNGTGYEPGDNVWSLDLMLSVYEDMPIIKGDFIYCIGTNDKKTEFGGRVEYLQVDRLRSRVRLKGSTWRGWLNRKILEPPDGQTHYKMNGEANSVFRQILDHQFDGLLKGSTADSNILLNKRYRFETFAYSLQESISPSGARLKVEYDHNEHFVTVSAEPRPDRSSVIELTSEDGTGVIATDDDFEKVNHIIALGGGEMLDREIHHLWRLPNGSITQDPTNPTIIRGLNERTYKYDFGSAEDTDELLKGARKIMNDLSGCRRIDVDLTETDIGLDLGDIVYAGESVTGISGKRVVNRRVLRLAPEADQYTLQYQVEEVK